MTTEDGAPPRSSPARPEVTDPDPAQPAPAAPAQPEPVGAAAADADDSPPPGRGRRGRRPRPKRSFLRELPGIVITALVISGVLVRTGAG